MSPNNKLKSSTKRKDSTKKIRPQFSYGTFIPQSTDDMDIDDFKKALPIDGEFPSMKIV